MTLVSIVIPCFNGEQFLGEAIASCLAQEHDDVEIIVVDDGSTDRSAAVAESVVGVRVVKQANKGPGAARNAGLQASGGEFVVFLDADDRLLPNAITDGLTAIQGDTQAAGTVGGFRWINESGNVTGIVPPEIIAGGREAQYEAMLRRSFLPMHAVVLYRKAAVIDVGGYDERLTPCEDFDLDCRLLRKHHLSFHHAIVADYRRHTSNASSDAARMVSTALTVMGRQYPYVRDDSTLLSAFNDGVRFWATAYTNDTVWPAATGNWLAGGRRALRGVAVLIRNVPWWFIARTRLNVRAAIRSRRERAAAWLPRMFGSDPSAQLRQRGTAAFQPRDLPIPIGMVRLGDFDRTEPIDRAFGFWRGWPVDRHYIDGFIGRNAADIHGRVLEIKDSDYTLRFGRTAVEVAEVLDVDSQNQMATIIADLADAPGIPANQYDCIILTQTLHIIYDVAAAIATVKRILKPGGVVLATVPGITKIDRTSPWFWSFTDTAVSRCFEASFPADHIVVENHGNVLAATAFLQGLALHELPVEVLDFVDPEYTVTVCVRAVKPGTTA